MHQDNKIKFHKKKKKNKANIQPILTLQLVNKGFIIWHKEPKKNDLRTYLFSTTEKEASYKQKWWRVSVFLFSSSIPLEK